MTRANKVNRNVSFVTANAGPETRLKIAVNYLAEATRKAHKSSYDFMEKIEDLNFKIAELERSIRKYQWRIGRVDVKPMRARFYRLAQIMESAGG